MAIGAQDYLFSAATASGAYRAMDCRMSLNYTYVQYATTNASAVVRAEASVDGVSGWLPIATYTASNSSGTAQQAGYFPYVRGVLVTAYNGATANFFWGAGLQ